MSQEYFEEHALGWAEYQNSTYLVPQAALMLFVLCVLGFLLPRKHALVPMIFLVCFMSVAQRIVVFGLDFNLTRVLVLTGGLRILIRGELSAVRWQRVDTVMVLWAIATSMAYTILRGVAGSSIYILGYMFETLGMYFLVRCFVRTWEDVWSLGRLFVLVAAVNALFFLNEMATGRNYFSFFGGVPEITVVREGKLRCQGAFAHPILAGCFWAAITPYMGVLWFRRGGGNRLLAVVGVLSAIAIIVACASSTPVGSLAAGVLVACWFPMRHHMGVTRAVVFATLLSLHFAMSKPVWHLLARVDIVGGSTGWHRYFLIDQAIRRFPEWALLGTASTAHWGRGLADLTNQFVLEGVRGGALGLALFIATIWLVFGQVGYLYRSVEGNREREVLAWALGVSLLVHIVNFVGVSYFGQVTFSWCLSLAVPVSLAEQQWRSKGHRPRSTGRGSKRPACNSHGGPAGTELPVRLHSPD